MDDTQPVEGQGTGDRLRPSLTRAADEYVQANREWSETFLRFKYAKPFPGHQSVTDGQARAQADVAVDLVGARTRYEVALEQFRLATALVGLEGWEPDATP